MSSNRVNKVKTNKSDNIQKLFIHLFFVILSAVFVIPLISIVSISISDESSILNSGYKIIPQRLSFSAFEFVLSNPDQIIRSYQLTILMTAVGTALSMFIMLMFAYAISRKKFKYRSFLALFVFFTMLFNGGLVPTYILVTQFLHLQNTFWVLVLSGTVNVWFLFILRTYIQDINESIFESAFIDGAGDFRIFLTMVLPLSKPAIATIGLFMLLQYWNEWMPALLYITKPELFPLQYLLQRILQNLQEILENMDKMPSSALDYRVPSESVRMAMAILAAGPMLFVLPFFQKYFVRGMTVGSVKG